MNGNKTLITALQLIVFYIGVMLVTPTGKFELGALVYAAFMIWLLYKASSNKNIETNQNSGAKHKHAPVAAQPEALQQGVVWRTQPPTADVIERASQAMKEATVKPESRWPSSLRIYDIGLLADSISEAGDTLMVGVLPYIVTKFSNNYERIKFTLFDHLAHTRGQWDQTYKFNEPCNFATPPVAIQIAVSDIDERWTLDMRVDGILFAVYHVNPADIVDGITDVGEITTRIGADGEIDEWARLAAAKSETHLSLDDLLDAPMTSSSKQKRNS